MRHFDFTASDKAVNAIRGRAEDEAKALPNDATRSIFYSALIGALASDLENHCMDTWPGVGKPPEPK